MNTPLVITSVIAVLWPVTALGRRFLKAHIARSVQIQKIEDRLKETERLEPITCRQMRRAYEEIVRLAGRVKKLELPSFLNVRCDDLKTRLNGIQDAVREHDARIKALQEKLNQAATIVYKDKKP